LAFGALQSLADLQRSGRSRAIGDDAKKWVLSVACQKPTEIGYAAETWTYSQLVKHIREHASENEHHCLHWSSTMDATIESYSDLHKHLSDITAKIKNTERENFGRSRRLMEACLIWLLYQKLKEQI